MSSNGAELPRAVWRYLTTHVPSDPMTEEQLAVLFENAFAVCTDKERKDWEKRRGSPTISLKQKRNYLRGAREAQRRSLRSELGRRRRTGVPHWMEARRRALEAFGEDPECQRILAESTQFHRPLSIAGH